MKNLLYDCKEHRVTAGETLIIRGGQEGPRVKCRTGRRARQLPMFEFKGEKIVVYRDPDAAVPFSRNGDGHNGHNGGKALKQTEVIVRPVPGEVPSPRALNKKEVIHEQI